MLDAQVIYTASYAKCIKCFEEGLPQYFIYTYFPIVFQSCSLEGAALKRGFFPFFVS